MKLYTELQVKKAIELAQECEHECGGVYFDYTEKEIIDELTPIELPGDEEIEREARLYCNIKESLVIDAEERYYKDFQKYDGFKACAQWMRNKIQGGNNEQQ